MIIKILNNFLSLFVTVFDLGLYIFGSLLLTAHINARTESITTAWLNLAYLESEKNVSCLSSTRYMTRLRLNKVGLYNKTRRNTCETREWAPWSEDAVGYGCDVEIIDWGHRRGEAWWTLTQAHNQVEIVEIVWKSRTSQSLGWNVPPVRKVVTLSRRSPSPWKELLPIAIWRSGGEGLVVCWLFMRYYMCIQYMWVKRLEVILFWLTLYNSASGIVENVFYLLDLLIKLRVVGWHSLHLYM